MNEWQCELLQEKKKHTKMPTNLGKKIRQLFFKGESAESWMAYELFQEKKYALYFFSALRKKKSRFSDLNEWIAHELYQGIKIRYLCLKDVIICKKSGRKKNVLLLTYFPQKSKNLYKICKTLSVFPPGCPHLQNFPLLPHTIPALLVSLKQIKIIQIFIQQIESITVTMKVLDRPKRN